MNPARGIASVIVVLLVVTSLFVGAGVMLFLTQVFRNSDAMPGDEIWPTSTSPSDDSLSEDSATDETANWKTYENMNFPFTFKYPPNTNIVPTANVATQFTLIYPEDELSIPMNLTFDYRKENISLNEYAKKQIANSKNSGEEILTNLSEENVNGLAGLTFTSKDVQVSGITAKHIFLKFPKGDNILGISHVGTHEEVANQILSTFKFTE